MNLISELWKRTLLDQHRTHVLKGVLCTMSIIKEHFQQIWPVLISEKRDDDEEPSKTFADKCRQAFEQANIDIKSNSQIIQSKAVSMGTEPLIDQLNQLLSVVQQMKEVVQSQQVLKIKNDEGKPNEEGKKQLFFERDRGKETESFPVPKRASVVNTSMWEYSIRRSSVKITIFLKCISCLSQKFIGFAAMGG